MAKRAQPEILKKLMPTKLSYHIIKAIGAPIPPILYTFIDNKGAFRQEAVPLS